MPELKGTKTEQNLMTAFAGESQARNKYSYFASKAKKEGYVQIANIFEETANNETEEKPIEKKNKKQKNRIPCSEPSAIFRRKFYHLFGL